MDELQLLSMGDLVEVAKIDKRGIPAHEGGQAYIRQLNHQNSGNVLVEFILGGRLVVPPAKILREVTLDTLSRRPACDGAATATEARSESTTTHHVYQKLLESRVDRHPMYSFHISQEG
jgi:hypothetical protein